MKYQPNPFGPARVRVALSGAVQGVGFRPFVHRLATELALAGWVNNSPQGVFIEADGERSALEKFLLRLETEKPPRSFIQSLETTWLDAAGFDKFEIRASETGGGKTALVLPDIATCPDCLREIFDPTNRRYRYPFTNCTNCGPRFSLIEALPYDRANTSMRQFAMCPECQAEYDDPLDRRFHAQPNACPVCGPRLEFWRGCVRENTAGPLPRSHERSRDALLAAANAIRAGKIVAAKGIGGFHLLVDARNENAVRLLRERKHREEKPFALMFPSLASVKAVCEVSALEERLLLSPEAPIVLLRKIADCQSPIANSVAPGNPNLGVMLPSNPLYHLLMAELDFPIVATSGNISDEPICTDEFEAMERLHGIADGFLAHNRPIVRHVDDSIVRVMLDREMILRRARGYAPLPVQVRSVECGIRNEKNTCAESNFALRTPNFALILAVGAHLKNAVALAVGENVFISQHIGDLETEAANHAFRRVCEDLPRLYDVVPQVIAADLHPDYLSTQYARELVAQASSPAGSGDVLVASRNTAQRCAANSPSGGPRYVGVQHHVAHVWSCIAENEIKLPALGVAWDGTGYGPDGTVWGGEFFLVTCEGVERVACLRPFRLPGGDAAVKEPRRAALGLLFELFGDAVFERRDLPSVAAFSPAELPLLKTMLTGGVNSPKTSSIGRLFDAVASLANLRQQMRFEGQAAMELEFATAGNQTDESYPLPTADCQSPITLDWSPMLEAILSDVQNGVVIGMMAAKFHNALAEAIVDVARKTGQTRVALSGGCFQNRYLTERTVTRLREEKFQPYWHQRVPTNDGGIALGQVVAAWREQIVNRKS